MRKGLHATKPLQTNKAEPQKDKKATNPSQQIVKSPCWDFVKIPMR